MFITHNSELSVTTQNIPIISWIRANQLLGIYLVLVTAWLVVLGPMLSGSICQSCTLVSNALPEVFDYFASGFWVAAYCLPIALFQQKEPGRLPKDTVGIRSNHPSLMVGAFIFLGLYIPASVESMVVLWLTLILAVIPVFSALAIYYLSSNLLSIENDTTL